MATCISCLTEEPEHAEGCAYRNVPGSHVVPTPIDANARHVHNAASYLLDVYDQLGISLTEPGETAMRVAKWLATFAQTTGPAVKVADLLKVFDDSHDEMVVVKDIQFVALCEHHLLPFSGRAAVGYIPNGKLVGLSKLARLVKLFCEQPTLQEHITGNVANALNDALNPRGCGVVLYDVMHACINLRGVADPCATTITSALRGVFKEEQETRNEFLLLIR